ncbi:MAG TPA: APC family permease [Candidatus Polarisedimenticolia bacterium]|jgi:amino acid transporter|nr:APC family permease [Candidatus Polarisedimenticolia bacterium]
MKIPRRPAESPDQPGAISRLLRRLFGAPRNVQDPRIFHRLSLVAFLAWVGLGADGLSSSAYGPAEAFKNLMARNPVTGAWEGQWYLAVFLALATAITVFIISYAYTRVIEQFPSGGGGYVVATKLLGERAGVVSGCALLVDYILTITVSVAAGGDALFDLFPAVLRTNHFLKVLCEIAVLGILIILNMRGVKESVTMVMPIFLCFLVTHAVLILGGALAHSWRIPEIAGQITSGVSQGIGTFGTWGLFLIFVRAFALGGGTFTGIEAVSNGIMVMREPKVVTGKKTMAMMAASLAFTAGGILLCYLLFDVQNFLSLPESLRLGRTLNGVLAENFAGAWAPAGVPVGFIFVVLILASEAALLFVAAQTGFIDGPRVMANMAVDSWLPHRFASLSDRLTIKDGVILIGGTATALLLLTRASIDTLVVMYAVNVFLTFSLTESGMCRFWVSQRKNDPQWMRHISVHVAGLTLCLVILATMVVEKFQQGAWKTLVITCSLIAFCVWVRGHYRKVLLQVRRLDHAFLHIHPEDLHGGEPDPAQPTAVLMVRDYDGIGIHSLLSIQRMFPDYFKNVVFVSAAVIDSGHFKGKEEVEALRKQAEVSVAKYVDLARKLGWNAAGMVGVGTDAVEEIYRMCIEVSKKFPRVMFFGGKLIWKRESWWQRILHNETAFQVQRRLQWKGFPMTIVPLRTGPDSPLSVVPPSPAGPAPA